VATRQLTITIDEELYDTTALLAEASAETSLSTYIIDAIAYTNRVRMGLPETQVKIRGWQQKKANTIERVIHACQRQVQYENDKREGKGQ